MSYDVCVCIVKINTIHTCKPRVGNYGNLQF